MREKELRQFLLQEAENVRRENGDPRLDGYRPTALLEPILSGERSWPEPFPASPPGGAPLPPGSKIANAASQAREGKAEPHEIRQLGRYEILALIDEGGMGRIYEARDRELDRKVAIKTIKDSCEINRDSLSRFVSEAKLTGQLQHPNIVPIHDFGLSSEGVLYFVMKKIPGLSLEQVLEGLRQGSVEARHTWTRHRLLSVFIQICQAVAYAHQQEVLHRDLKPANVMLGTFGEVLVMDWGAARLLSGPTKKATLAIGTPGYVSPERIQGAHSDKRSDIWGLGAVLYEVLTWQPAYPRQDTQAMLAQTLAGPPEHPGRRSPTLGVPPEIAGVAMKALSTKPQERFSSAGDMATAVEEFLEGSRRREKVARHLAQARQKWEEFRLQDEEFKEKSEHIKELARPIRPWAPLEEKRALWALKALLSQMESDLAASFAMVVAVAERALAEEPNNAEARAFLADAYWSRFQEAENRGEASARRFYQGRVRAYNDGRYTDPLRGTGSLSLRTDPRGAEVFCRRYHQRGLIWTLSEETRLGVTPLDAMAMEMGSYLLVIRSPGKRDTLYPVHITRCRQWDSGEKPIRLYSEETIGEGFVYVPPGAFLYGGDSEIPETMPSWDTWEDGFFIAEFPVTVGRYLECINVLRAQDADLAWDRVPRRTTGADDPGEPLWDRPRTRESYELPQDKKKGSWQEPREPIWSISWHDALAYAEWASERDGVIYGLPREAEWEKAARGVDRRLFPWGSAFDPILCKMRDSRQASPTPEPVGAFPHDVSVYGVRDMAGSAREWCGDEDFDGDPNLRPVRGGAWLLDARGCRLAFRNQIEPWRTAPGLSFRLIRRDLP